MHIRSWEDRHVCLGMAEKASVSYELKKKEKL